MIKACVLIPVYNHEHAIAEVVNKIQAQELALDCLLIDDGSTESCADILKALSEQYANVDLIQHSHNQGKGAAFKTGLREAAQRGYTHVIQIDADGQHDVDDIPYFITQAQQNPEAIINGVALYDDSVPKIRQYGRYLTHFWVWVNTLSFTIQDSMCGFRLYPVASTLEVINSKRVGDRMDFDSEILVRSHWHGVPIIPLPTRVHYPSDGVSHFQVFRDNVMITRMHTRLFFSMLAELPGHFWRKLRKA